MSAIRFRITTKLHPLHVTPYIASYMQLLYCTVPSSLTKRQEPSASAFRSCRCLLLVLALMCVVLVDDATLSATMATGVEVAGCSPCLVRLSFAYHSNGVVGMAERTQESGATRQK